jgi:hypothetical protein
VVFQARILLSATLLNYELYTTQTDPLTTLLTKYVPNPEKRPPRDTAGEYARADFHTLVVRVPPLLDATLRYNKKMCHAQMTNSWRALARMARDRLVQTDPEDLDRVFNVRVLRPLPDRPPGFFTHALWR